MHLNEGWTSYLLILASCIPADGQSEMGDCYMPPFFCVALPKDDLVWAYPEWKLVGSYEDIVYAFDRAEEILRKLNGDGSSVSVWPRHPNLTTWKNWVEFNKRRSFEDSRQNDSFSTGTKADEKKEILWLITLNRNELKDVIKSANDSFPDFLILLTIKSNNYFQYKSNYLGAQFSKKQAWNHSSSVLDETHSLTGSRSDPDTASKSVSEELSLLSSLITPTDDILVSGEINIDAPHTANVLKFKSKTENRERQVPVQSDNTPKESVPVSIKIDDFKLSSLGFLKHKLEVKEQIPEKVKQEEGIYHRFRKNVENPNLVFQNSVGKLTRSYSYDKVRRKTNVIQTEQSSQNLWSSLLNIRPQRAHLSYSAVGNIVLGYEDSGFKKSSENLKDRFEVSQKETRNSLLKGTVFKNSQPRGFVESSEGAHSADVFINKKTVIDQMELRKSLPSLRGDDPYFERNCERFLTPLQVDEKEQKEIFEATIEQAECERWHQERKYRLTASCFGIVYNWTDTKKRLVYRLLYSVMQNSTEKRAALDWGKEHERTAARDYAMAKNVTIERSGLIVDLKRGYLAASPDGLIGNDTICEIKCPYFLRDSVPSGLIKTNDLYCCTYDFDKGQVRLKRDHYYYYQMQGQMGISGRKKGVFILWSPKGLLSETIDFDPELWDKMVNVLENFYKQYLVPEFLYNYHRYKTHRHDCDV